MFHQILYAIHIIGMTAIITISLYLLIKKNIPGLFRKKLALYLMSAAHTQLLSGFILFFLLLSNVNHMKVGIKMLLAIEIAAFASIYRKKISKDENPNTVFLFVVITSAIAVTIVAFLM